MSQLLGSHFGLNNELNSMTDELARRYEELNLVYNTDEDIRTLSERESLLDRIVETCIDHLEVDAAALCLIEREDVIASQRYGVQEDLIEHVNALRMPILNLMSKHGASIVLNTAEERAKAGLDMSFDRKIVISPIKDAKGRLHGALALFNGLSSRDFENGDRNLLNVTAEKLSKVVGANYDSLTGLITREGFETAVQDVLVDATKRSREICLLHANIDQIQLVNDTFGHAAGDKLIQEVSATLSHLLRENDRISRLGGDEFGILLLDCSLENATRMADRLCDQMAQIKCESGDRRLDVGISIGIAKIEDDVNTVIGAMATADLACSVAKEQGRGRSFAYRSEDKEMKERKHQMHWVGTIQSSLKANRFELFSQVIEPTCPTGKPHFEILLRMLDKNDQILPPVVFMPVAERYHLMPTIDQWVIEHSLATLAKWGNSDAVNNSVFTINLSGQSLMDEKTLEFLIGQLQVTDVNPENLCFEVTENAAITDHQNAQKFISSIKCFGSRFALDDFGAGVSSFANLRALDVDYLKIDGSFVVDMATDQVSASMVSAINQVGQTMKLHTVAEFVESQQIRDILVELGVDYLQGYDIGRPRPLIEQLHDLSLKDALSA